MTLQKGMWVKLTEGDFTSKPYKVIDFDKDTVTVQILEWTRLRDAYNLKVPLEHILDEN